MLFTMFTLFPGKIGKNAGKKTPREKRREGFFLHPGKGKKGREQRERVNRPKRVIVHLPKKAILEPLTKQKRIAIITI
jgi:hypothetical protein